MVNETKNVIIQGDSVLIPREEYEDLLSYKADRDELSKQVAWLKEQMGLNKHQQFGASSEKGEPFEQASIFNEAEAVADPTLEEPPLEKVKEHVRKARKRTVDKLPEEIPVEVVEHEISPEGCVCPCCGEQMHDIGKEIVREELKIIPAQAVLVKHVRHSYSCRHCERTLGDEAVPVVKAEVPQGVIKGSYASPEAVAHIAVQKFVMGSPLYRQEQEFNRQGIPIPRQTMANWMIMAAMLWLEPLFQSLYELLLGQKVLFADETIFQVLREPGKSAESNSYLWVYRTGNYSPHPIVLSEYQPSRSGEHPKAFLEGFTGYLHCDGYQGYHNLPPGITVVGCLGHLRRKFQDALKVIPKKERGGSNAWKGRHYCDRLFVLEEKMASFTPERRYEQRQKLAKPILDEFHNWLLSLGEPGKSLFGQAVTYALNQWKYLNNYLLDGRLEISNNRSERTVKMFVISRKNFLFANSVDGAKASAYTFSLIQTAIENGLDPYRYLTYVFRNAPNWDIRSKPENIERLLPWNAPDSIKVSRKP